MKVERTRVVACEDQPGRGMHCEREEDPTESVVVF